MSERREKQQQDDVGGERVARPAAGGTGERGAPQGPGRVSSR